MLKLVRFLTVLGLVLILATVHDAVVLAQGTSNNYRIDESFVGPGGNLESGSSSFSLEAGQQSVGNAGVVESMSSSYRGQGGYTTTADLSLTCTVETAGINFGAFSTATTQTATANFHVLNYTAYGYVVNVIGSPPSTGSHSLSGMNPAGASQVGAEQFGINLVANTSPESMGAFPEQIPDSSFSFGDATDNYDDPDNYRYVAGEAIAAAPESSGVTRYTISYIVNVSTNTPGGTYSTDQVILCTGTY